MMYPVWGTAIFKGVVLSLACAIALPLLLSDDAFAKRRGDDSRSRFYGIIQVRPASGLHGEWMIGGRTFITDSRTEFNQSEGALAPGSCAKVDIRSGRVHEIDSEPMRNCR